MNFEIFQYLNGLALQYEWLDSLIIFSAEFLIWWLLFFAAVLIFLRKKKILRFLALFIGSIIAAYLISKLIKYFYPNPRPFLVLKEMNWLISHGGNDSFPSTHAAVSFATASVISLGSLASKCTWKQGFQVMFFLGALMVSLSRVIAGIHWPLDIFVGAILGIVVVFVIDKIISRFYISRQNS